MIGLNQVNGAVNQMDQVTQQNAAMVEEATAAAASLRSEAIGLSDLTRRFRVSEGARPAGPQSSQAQLVANTASRAPRRLASTGGGQAAVASEWQEF